MWVIWKGTEADEWSAKWVAGSIQDAKEFAKKLLKEDNERLVYLAKEVLVASHGVTFEAVE